MGCDIHMWLMGKHSNDLGYTEITLYDNEGKKVGFPYFRHYDTFGTLCEGVRSMGVLKNNHPRRGRFKYAVEKYKDQKIVYKDYDEAFLAPSTILNYVHDTYKVGDEEKPTFLHSHTWIEIRELEKMVKKLRKLKDKDTDGNILATYHCVKNILKYAKNAIWMMNMQFFETAYNEEFSVILIAFDN